MVGNFSSGFKSCCIRLAYFLRRLTKDIRKRGLPILFRKLCVILLILLAVPIVFLIRILRPLILISFGPLMSPRIGHFAANTEIYLSECDVGMHNPRSIDIFYHIKPICNHQLKKMWDRTLHVSRSASFFFRANRWLPGGKKHVIPWRKNEEQDIYRVLTRTRPHLSFTPEEECLGQMALRKMGIPEDALFVCFYARDSAYLDIVYSNGSWRYHDYRDSNIHNYIPAVEELVHRRYFTIRMGAIVKEALTTSNSMIIDYATKSKTDFLDIYLCAKCRFFIGSTGGINAVPVIFRRPVAYVNFIPLGRNHLLICPSGSLVIPKKLWLREEHRFLTFREILDSGIERFKESEKYKKLGIEVIENTSEEIKALAVEMDERLNGKWQTTKEDEELQQRFWSLFKPSGMNQVLLPRIGAEFLRQNQELL